ncbi:DUF4150 domain-containing protein [Consotaella aegiceratis]|uniref:DUF4150 domain-containing protein n=1 Tax=Consotaella aegiceratis TaxID=3097961 RepID=UPI002F406735
MSYPPRRGSRDTSEGLVISKYPDVCRSPVAPVPYTIVAYQSDDANTATSVRFTGQRAHKQDSIITCCTGDEPGTGLGVKSNTVASVCHRKEHSKTVRIEGQWATRDGDEWWMNNKNTIGRLVWPHPGYSDDPTPPLKEQPADEDAEAADEEKSSPQAGSSGGEAAQGAVMSDASPSGYVVGEQYAYLPDMRRYPQPGTDAKSSPPTATKSPPKSDPSIRWWRIVRKSKSALLAELALIGEAFHRLKGMRQRLEEAHQQDLERQGLTPDAIETSLEQQFKSTDFGRWYPGTFKDYAEEITADPTAEARLQKQWLEERAREQEVQEETHAPPTPIGRTENNVSVRGAKSECDELCELACQCKRDRQGERTLTDCVSKKLRQKYYDKEGRKFADGTPRRPTSPTADGPRPEVSYRQSDGTYQPVESRTDPGMPSSQVPITGAPRPDVSWWKNGQLWKIFELKFKGDTETLMQRNGAYKDIARDQGLDPDEDVIKLDVEKDCVEGSDGRCKAKPDKC